jgi:excisionase family DNA binding protein|tara:strand:+ start:139 stop:345 length:207 start_codon:yes stop_codon:yes gene_type:complete
MNNLLSIENACEVLDISDTTLYKLLSLGKPEKRKINSFTIGRRRKIDAEEIEKFIQELQQNGSVPIEK